MNNTRGLALEIGSRCDVFCGHCMMSRGPESSGEMSLDLIKRSVDSASLLGISWVCATGGEPFLYPHLLKFFLSEVRSKSLHWTVVTNGNWGRYSRVPSILDTMSEYKDGYIAFSVDRFHQEIIALDSVQRAIEISRSKGVYVKINFCLDRHPQSLNLLREIASWQVPVVLQPLNALGRGRDLDTNCLLMQLRQGAACEAIHLPLISANGKVAICCSLPPSERNDNNLLLLGDACWGSLPNIIQRHSSSYISVLANVGPYHVYDVLIREAPQLLDKIDYNSSGMCNMCMSLIKQADIVKFINDNCNRFTKKATSALGLDLLNNAHSIHDFVLSLHPDVEILEIQSSDFNTNGFYNTSKGVIAFICNDVREYCVVDTILLDILKQIEDNKWQTVASNLSTPDLPSMDNVSLRLKLAALIDIGVLVIVGKMGGNLNG